MPDTIAIRPIGSVCGSRAEPIDDSWDRVEARIEIDPDQFKPDAAPVLDIKPVMKGFLPRGEIVEPDRAGELMREYW
jgi:tRNA (Thr-GGU) A37 N-methylase